MPERGTKIRAVAPGSPAHFAGLASGDEILEINGHPVPDELAVAFHLAEERVKLRVRKADGSLSGMDLDLTDGMGLGAEFEGFHTRTCNNSCVFCFIHQLPPGVRKSLKVKDDDYRLSFLHGNYITLTNLSETDLERIIEQKLSPLYISVHATAPDLRTKILGRRKVDDLAGKINRLIDGGILLNTQIVLMPGINDGRHLENTVFDLFSWHPGVHSVAIVPLGLSHHGFPRERLTAVTADFCREVIEQVKPWQQRFRKETGRRFAYLADEFYIQGGHPIPGAREYDDFAQIEDGVGMVRSFLDEFSLQLARRRKSRQRVRGTLATGSLFFPFLRDCTNRLNRRLGSDLRVVEVENRVLGKSITVAGLLAGRDFAEGLAGQLWGDFIVIPEESVSQATGVFIDDLAPADLERRLGTPVYLGGRTVRDFFSLVCRR